MFCVVDAVVFLNRHTQKKTGEHKHFQSFSFDQFGSFCPSSWESHGATGANLIIASMSKYSHQSTSGCCFRSHMRTGILAQCIVLFRLRNNKLGSVVIGITCVKT
jgi:hypothetical protein